VPLLNDAPLLDVRLTRDGHVRRWTISKWSMGWTCRFVDNGNVSVGGCSTLERMEAKRQQWEAEIAAARADGWS
jgi:hypothetical protein